ncbi:MAG: hypothetical protein ACP5QG_04905 [candidate division WOR-3 bacterium]
MQKIVPILIAIVSLSCVPRGTRLPRDVLPETAAAVLSAAASRNAFSQQLTAFGRYRGTQGLLVLEGSFTLSKDTSLMRLVLHGPFGGVLSVVDLPNQGPASLLFGVPDESIADSVISASRVGNLILLDLRLGYDTARVSIEGKRIKSLSMWGENFFFADYRRLEGGLEFPFRVDYSGTDGQAALFFEEVKLVGGE